MLKFILRRLALAVPTLLAVSLLVFLAARLAPSSPIDILAGEKATPERKAEIAHAYGLDRPLAAQYFSYLAGIVTRGDFGRSFARGGQPVREMIAADFPATAQLAFFAALFAIGVGLPAGILAALRHDTAVDRVVMGLVVALVSVPGIVLGPLLALFLAVRLHMLPVSGWESPASLVLPTITLGARSAALLARFMRSSLLDVLRQDYMRTALAKGLSFATAVRRHAIKNAILPVLSAIGATFGALLTGSFVVETIFQIPGIGFESINSIARRDYPVIQGIALLVAAIYLGVNLLVDILYGFADPRIRSQGMA